VVQHPLDVDGCEATMPDPNKIPLPGGSAVLIKVPSVTHWFLNVDQFNEDSGEGCATTLDQRQSIIRDIEENGDRKSKYYMLLFPNGTSLDNSVFGHDNVVNMKHIPMADFLPTKGANNEELAVGMALQWNISEIGHRKTQAGLPSADVAAILAKKRAEFVKNYLIRQGAKTNQIISEGRGYSKQISVNKNTQGKYVWNSLGYNRRVEIEILNQGENEKLFVKPVEVPDQFQINISGNTYYYSVNIVSSIDKIPSTAFDFDVTELLGVDGLYNYIYGEFEHEYDAENFVSSIKNKYPKSFVFINNFRK